MKATGVELREAIRLWNIRREKAEGEFAPSLKRYEDDAEKRSPLEVEAELIRAEDAIAHLEAAQAYFNLNSSVKIGSGEKVTLTYAVKRLGGASRVEKLWSKQLKGEEVPPYARAVVRTKDHVIERATIPAEQMMEQALAAARFAGQLRNAIGAANAQSVEIPFLQPELLRP